MSFHERTTHAATGKWRGILRTLGVPAECLTGKHGPCPMCGGEDRFRFDDKERRGTYYCNACGAGDGMNLAMNFMRLPFQEVADRIDQIVGNIKADAAPRPAMTDDDRRTALRAVWSNTQPVAAGDLAHQYLASRGVDEVIYPKALRFGRALADGDGGLRPAMVAVVTDRDGKPVTLHRTFLRPDGKAKAEMTSPRKLMPGEVPEGACVRLSDFTDGALGVAEGIETAMSASALYGLPVWSALNTTLLTKWWPPEGCTEVAVFADNDANFGGQAAAFALAHRLSVKGVAVTVHVPPDTGDDFNDILMRGR